MLDNTSSAAWEAYDQVYMKIQTGVIIALKNHLLGVSPRITYHPWGTSPFVCAA